METGSKPNRSNDLTLLGGPVERVGKAGGLSGSTAVCLAADSAAPGLLETCLLQSAAEERARVALLPSRPDALSRKQWSRSSSRHANLVSLGESSEQGWTAKQPSSKDPGSTA